MENFIIKFDLARYLIIIYYFVDFNKFLHTTRVDYIHLVFF